METLNTLKKEVEDGARALEHLREEWRLDRKSLSEQIIQTTRALLPDVLPPVTLHGLLESRIADKNTPNDVAQAMASMGARPHLARLQELQDILFTLGVSDSAVYRKLALEMELLLPDACSCSNHTLADRWLHDNHGRYNLLIRDLLEDHNYRSRLRGILTRDRSNKSPAVETSRRAELATFLYLTPDQRWFAPTPA